MQDNHKILFPIFNTNTVICKNCHNLLGICLLVKNVYLENEWKLWEIILKME